MGDENGNGLTFEHLTGFLDYYINFPKVEAAWTVIGSIFFLTNFISFFPQTIELVEARSSYGIEPLAVFCQSLGHFLCLINIICFKTLDFVGYFQYPTMRAFPRILAFMNIFFQWAMFLPVIFLSFILHDREPREKRGLDTIKVDWWKSAGQAMLLMLVFIILISIWLGLSLTYGFETPAVTKYGEACGTIATALEFCFFVPQMWTTCKLQDEGSLSLLMLEIQAPADLANALYMWVGTGDHWTTWLCIFINSLEEFTILGTCLLFKCLKAHRAKKAAAAEREQLSLLASIEPEPIPVKQRF